MPRARWPYQQALTQNRLWTPAALGPGLLCWFDFGEAPWVEVSAGEMVTVRGQNGAPDFITTGAPARPAVSQHATTGRTEAAFSGSSRMWTSAPVAFRLPAAVVMLARLTASTATSGRLLSYAETGQDDRFSQSLVFFERFGVNSLRTSQANGLNASLTEPFDNSHAMYSLTVSSLGTPTLFRDNAASIGTTIPNRTFTTGTIQISAAGPNNQPSDAILDGAVLFAAVYTGADFGRQRLRLEGYMAWRSGFQSLLSATHPFRNAPPLLGG